MRSPSFYGTDGGVALRNVGGSFYDFEALRFAGIAHERGRQRNFEPCELAALVAC